MPKVKTHSGMKKRIKVTGSGKLRYSTVAKKHLLSDKSKKAKGRGKYGITVSAGDTKAVKTALGL